MPRTLVGLFDNRDDAMRAVHEIERQGVPSSDISIVANNKDTWFAGDDREDRKDSRIKDADHDGRDDRVEGAQKGATTGGALGVGVGLLAGLGLLAVPGLGPVVAAGWVASALTGGAVGAVAGGVSGGLLGALKKEGIPEEDAHIYAEGVKRGGALVTVRTMDADAEKVTDILERFNAADVTARRQEYTSGGWSQFDESRPI